MHKQAETTDEYWVCLFIYTFLHIYVESAICFCLSNVHHTGGSVKNSWS